MFERPFDENDSMVTIPEDLLAYYRTYVKKVEEMGLKKKLGDLFKTQTCFLHGDCHMKSIFVKEGRVVVGL